MTELVKFLKEQKAKETGAFSKGLNKGLNIAISAIKNPEICPTIEQPKWIPVTERLPDAWIPVLLYAPSEHPLPTVGEGYIDEIGRFHAHRMMAIFGDGEVTHWMPMPEFTAGTEG